MVRRFVPQGVRYALVAFVAGVLAAVRSPFAAAAGLLVSGFVLQFYRDPERRVAPTGAVSPADGRVSVIREAGDRLRVGVYMSATDVHVNRAPLGGTVREVTRRPGAYKPAFSKDSDENEQVELVFEDHSVVLIAGWFARRIHPSVAVGDTVQRGERIGHISFGSRADVVLPPEVTRDDLTVEEGDRVYAGQTALAYTETDRHEAVEPSS
ncbi:protein sorting system archaetidylserine decarboxylase [Halomarina oriensis]|uniref:Phosphatidylserine decarboxylase n=1 Tax=Halomarina oriensis TaxID=671145 RepID=A0A6B0GFX6_9EURY|nr:protein sorting system archaetidylserine decarboxylase [Halomarina oriensis]MWG33604.1 phosphatidylserine decarboxylase [Halomarina oriensis]